MDGAILHEASQRALETILHEASQRASETILHGASQRASQTILHGASQRASETILHGLCWHLPIKRTPHGPQSRNPFIQDILSLTPYR